MRSKVVSVGAVVRAVRGWCIYIYIYVYVYNDDDCFYCYKK